MIKIIDMQVNYGKSVFGPNSLLEKYLYNAINIGIREFVIIPTLTHELQISRKERIFYKNAYNFLEISF